jgi:hypothetical protein
MLDPSPSTTATTLTEILGWAREVSIIGFIVGVAWKCRGMWDDAQQFLERIGTHMTKMENFAETVVDNHLAHIEKSLEKLARAKNETVVTVEDGQPKVTVKHGTHDEQNDNS